MHSKSLVALALAAPASALLRFGCSQLTVVRVDPLVNPGQTPSPHLHQIIGGVSFFFFSFSFSRYYPVLLSTLGIF